MFSILLAKLKESELNFIFHQLRDVDEKLREEGDSRALSQRREQLHEKGKRLVYEYHPLRVFHMI